MDNVIDDVNSGSLKRDTKSMKTYVAAFTFSVVFVAPLWYLLVCSQMGVPTTSSRWISSIYAHKISIAESTRSPKIEIVGGSSSLFGISAARVESATGIPTVNMGTHAGLGLEYILWRVRPTLHRGDLVLLSIEYELYGGGDVNDVFLDYIFSRDPAYFRLRSPIERLHWAYALSPGRVLEGQCNRLHPPNPEDIVGYDPKTINEHGDETANSVEAASERWRQLKLEEAVPANTALTAFSDHSRAWAHIVEFKQWCDANRVRVVATFPNTMHFPKYDEPAARTNFLRLVETYRHLNIPTLGTPSDFLYEREDMYDASYHLNARGVRKRTDRLIDLMNSNPALWEGLRLDARTAAPPTED